MNDNYNNEQPNFNNHFISFCLHQFIEKQHLVLDMNLQLTILIFLTEPDWLVTELGYRISGANLISVSYGRERYGQVCSNGICRYLLPFKGFKFNLQTNL